RLASATATVLLSREMANGPNPPPEVAILSRSRREAMSQTMISLELALINVRPSAANATRSGGRPRRSREAQRDLGRRGGRGPKTRLSRLARKAHELGRGLDSLRRRQARRSAPGNARDCRSPGLEGHRFARHPRARNAS